MKNTFLLFLCLLLLHGSHVIAQSPVCDAASRLCMENSFSFQASVNAAIPPQTNNYGCLTVQSNPAWFYINPSRADSISINLSSSPLVDIDYVLWGPYSSLVDALGNCGSLGPPIDCSYDPGPTEEVSFSSSGPSEFFILLVTNFSNEPTEITGFSTSRALSCLPVPVATFSQTTTSGCAPLTVTYDASNSINVDSVQWAFPGGTPSSSIELMPTVAYDESGVFDVQLIASNPLGSDTLNASNHITADTLATAVFSSDINSLSVDFTSTSASTDTYSWDFGNGATSTDINPSVTYALAGSYTVTLTVTNSCGQDLNTQMITVAAGLPNVGFSISDTSGCAPLVVSLTDETTGSPTAWDWTVSGSGGANYMSTEQNPIFTLTQDGVYTFTLEARNEVGAATEVRSDEVTVFSIPTVQVEVESILGAMVTFDATFTNTDSYLWDFGDGSTSTIRDPSHTYAADGTYTIILTAMNECGEARDTTTVSIMVSALDNLPEGAVFNLFPNPTSSIVTWSLQGVPSEQLTLSVTDVLGREVLRARLGAASSFRQNLSFDNWAAGVYVVRLSAESYDHQVRVVKQ